MPSAVPAMKPMKMKPTCEIVEYASMRFKFVCAIATRLPIPNDSTHSTISMSRQPPSCRPPRPSTSTRHTSANDAIFGTEPMNNVTGVGAPWYTSGSHMWNGTAPNLNATPTMMNASASSAGTLTSPPPMRVASSARFSVPVMPYSSEMPYSSVPDAIAPSTKYFIAASADTAESRLNATSVYCESANTSSPRYSVSRLPAEIMIMMPSKPNSPSTKNSPFSSPLFCRYSREYRNVMPTVTYANIFSTLLAGSVT